MNPALGEAYELAQRERLDEAEVKLAGLLEASPDDLDAHFLLASLRYMRGDREYARSLAEASSRDGAPPKMRVAYADVLRMGGDVERAEEILRDVIARCGMRPDAANALGLILQEAGRYAEAVTFAEVTANALPTNANAAENLVSSFLSAGDPRRALPIVERFRERDPEDQRWLAYRSDVARHLGEGLFADWCDPDSVVRAYDLAPPPGFDSIAAFHAVLKPALDARHDARRGRRRPLDQSLRAGSQIALGPVGVASADPLIGALVEAFAAPLEAYRAEMGQDSAHPLRKRNVTPAKLVGYWSVRLTRTGFHLNHFHQRGWISSVYYVSVPSEVEDAGAMSGWLKFGEPTFATPMGKPTAFKKPRAGMLVLFPSYLWHGTTPIHGDEPRLTFAFDAVPAEAP
jgi:tetratricopeptide (TPR) repeat protein